MEITREMIDKAEGRQLDELLAHLLGWINIGPSKIDRTLSGLNPKFCHQMNSNYVTTIPEWSSDLNLIADEFKKYANTYDTGYIHMSWNGDLISIDIKIADISTTLARVLGQMLLKRKEKS